MTVFDLQKNINLEMLAGEGGMDRKVEDVYIGDMLSWVIGNASDNSAWITIQTNVNIVAVAVMVGISCIIIAENASVDPETLKKAENEAIPILRSHLTSYQLARKINLGN